MRNAQRRQLSRYHVGDRKDALHIFFPSQLQRNAFIGHLKRRDNAIRDIVRWSFPWFKAALMAATVKVRVVKKIDSVLDETSWLYPWKVVFRSWKRWISFGESFIVNNGSSSDFQVIFSFEINYRHQYWWHLSNFSYFIVLLLIVLLAIVNVDISIANEIASLNIWCRAEDAISDRPLMVGDCFFSWPSQDRIRA